MKIYLVGGFLGSGKTTAIANACQQLKKQGLKVGVITNDQGQYLVDSEFLSAEGISSAQVTGGCFCCNYDQLDEQIQRMTDSISPDVIFAESVGSCTDLVATVLKPLLKFRGQEMEGMTLSCFVDARMLMMHSTNKRLPFSADTTYIWEKQIEEASLIVVNKIDLVNTSDLPAFKQALTAKYPDKRFLFQNSLQEDSVREWLNELDRYEANELISLDLDYAKYGKGEAELAWLDEQITIKTFDGTAIKVAIDFIEGLTSGFKREQLPIGHLKLMITSNGTLRKISFTTVSSGAAETNELKSFFGDSNEVQLTVNARVQTAPEVLRGLLEVELGLLRTAGAIISEENIAFFSPGFPTPTHQITS
ncbi:GTP-binding protein [uncultured Imperialibacter sp.]|uniref:GTP-binding protein n=1 Tax=uncultured Imperialibacter sp. TaxID=1672639 RepID=UPI0030D7591E|tara:strand:- start:4868 stop:5956 length:1089 start_codon:yes stop_codon:yes gene_type:complete